MSIVWFVLYNLLAVPLMIAGFYIGSVFNAKMSEGRKSRRGQFARLRSAIATAGPGRKRILFHCTSAGEWLQALPIIEKLKVLNPGTFIMVSFFSPSGFRFAKNPPEVDLKFYLPLDTRRSSRRLFQLLKPECWIISKFDIWPNHIRAANAMQIPIIITSATLSPDSGRDKGITKYFNKPVYNMISHFFPISEEDKKRFQVLVPDEYKYTVAGDTRYDHVFNRGQRAMDAGDVKIFSNTGGITLIAGSTWPADEKHVLPALAHLLRDFPDIKAIVVPHELQENHLRDIGEVFTRQGIVTTRYTEFSGQGETSARLVIFNTVGLLARLYKQTHIAFIGGGFGKGLHNVMEPAVFGQPVLFGPNHLNSHEAGELLNIGAAFRVTNGDEIYEKMSLLINDNNLRSTLGEKARHLVHDNTGATAIIINKLKTQYDIIP
jgi:3-deoxy-D-manno-octulosonic-acid transferase